LFDSVRRGETTLSVTSWAICIKESALMIMVKCGVGVEACMRSGAWWGLKREEEEE